MAGVARNRIEFENNVVQEQAIWQLLPNILSKKKSRGMPLTEKECHQIKELELLWEKCADPSHVVSFAAVGVLVELVCQTVMDFDYVMNGFINRIPSTRHSLGPIHGVTELLCLQMNSSASGTSPYSLRSLPHPYISVLAHSPNSWTSILDETKNCFESAQNSSFKSAFRTFEPFFTYILLNPKSDSVICRALHSLLLDVATELSLQADRDILDSILNLIKNHVGLYKKNAASLGHSVSLCHHTLQRIMKINDERLDKHLKGLTILLLELCHEQLLIGIPMLSSLAFLNKITKVKPWALFTSGSIFALSNLLLKCSRYYFGELLNIGFNLSKYIIETRTSGTAKLSILVLPLLQILASSNYPATSKTNILSLSSALFSQVEKTLQAEYPSDNAQEEKSEPSFLPGSWLRKMSACEKMFLLVKSSEPTVLIWLKSIESSLLNHVSDLSNVSLILSSFLLNCSDNTALQLLTTIATLCKADPTQAPYFLPLLLFELERCVSSEIKLQILYTIPKLATHKICVKQVLGTLLVLNNNGDLKAITLRLMFKLWQLQPRVYSQLQKLLEEKTLSLSREAWTELQLARAVTIRDICKESSSQYGEDLVIAISQIINENAHLDSKINVVLVCLALEALQALAADEILDLVSTWNILRNKLEQNHHPLVIRALCDLFSIVPSVAVESQDYEDFKASVLSFLWKSTQHEDALVSGASFAALAKFDATDFVLGHLPNKNRRPLIEQLKNTPKVKRMIEERRDVDEKEEEIDFDSFPIPAYFYVDLLQRAPAALFPAFEELLKNLVKQEISRLPRGLVHSVMKRKKISENKMMASIPGLLKAQYEKCKQPSLKPSIASSLLFSYELQVEKRAGRAIRSQLVNNPKTYRHIIDSLLHEVPVQSSEWLRNVDMCRGWTVFMTRVFNASVEGRKAELAMQKDREHIDDEQYSAGLQSAWLWVRDLLTEQLRKASKGSHVMQGNSLLALAGLAKATLGYQNSMEQDQNETKAAPAVSGTDKAYTTMQEWIATVTDTFLVILDGNLKTLGEPMDWCQQVSSVTSSASSVLARACSALGLSQLLPILLAEEFERVQYVIQVLQVRIPGQAKAGSSSVIQTHCSLGLGLVLQQLYQENFSDCCGQEGSMLVARALDALETAALSHKLGNTEGAIYGLGLAMTSLCKDAAVSTRMHANNTYSKMIELYESQGYEDSAKLQVFSLAIAYSTIGLFETDILDVESVMKTTSSLERTVEKFPEDHVLASAFGLLLYGLKICGLRNTEELFSKWIKHWQYTTLNQSASPGLRVAAVCGYSFLSGSELPFCMTEFSPVCYRSFLENGVKILKQVLHLCTNVTSTGTVLCQLGRLWFAFKSLLNNQSTAPDNMDYLGEDSILNSLVHFLIQFSRTGAPGSSIKELNCILRVLTDGPNDPFPPLNWTNILTPLAKKFGSETTKLCLDFALCSSSSNATGSFLASWLSPSVVVNLRRDCKVRLYSSLDQLVRLLPKKKSREILKSATLVFAAKEIDVKIADAVLSGLHSVLAMTDPPKSLVSRVIETVKDIYHDFPNYLKGEHETLISKLGNCFQYFPPDEVDSITQPKQDTFIKSLSLRKQLTIKDPKQYWKLVKPCVDRDLSTGVDFNVLLSVGSSISCLKCENISEVITEWVIQLLASLQLPENTSEAVNTIFVVLAVLILTATSKDDVTLTLTLKDQDTLLRECSKTHRSVYLEWYSIMKSLLPAQFPRLLERPEWKLPVEKVIDRLLCLLQSCNLEASRPVVETLLELRQFDAYEKRSVWTQVVSCL